MTDETLEERLRNIPPPPLVCKMHEHYARTGSFRPEDVARVLGDPTKGVGMGTTDFADAVEAGVIPKKVGE